MSGRQIVTPPLYNSICNHCGLKPYGWLKSDRMGLSEADYEKEGGYMQDGAILVCPNCDNTAEFRWERNQVASRFNDNSDGTITDTQTKLMWQREDDGQKRTLEESKAYCKSLRLGGYQDWRLPTIAELRSISTVWKEIFANPRLDDPYWSSTVVGNPEWEPVAGEKHKYIVMVLFSNSSENTYFPYYKYYTRAVCNARPVVPAVLSGRRDTRFA